MRTMLPTEYPRDPRAKPSKRAEPCVTPYRRTAMRLIATVALGLALSGCAGPAEDRPLDLSRVTADPETYEGERVDLMAGYYGAFEVSVLTQGFAESYPPQPMEPQVWVTAGPGRDCIERAETVVWAERVRATGVFRYDPDGGFGHLGAYEMALEDATVSCA